MKKIIKFLLVVIWMGVIFMFSNDTATSSSKKSDHVILSVYQTFHHEKLTEQQEKKIIREVVYPTRKIAHFSEYFLLGIFLLSFISEFYAITWKSILITIGLCFLYAVSDEVHQLFIDGRGPRAIDVVIDTSGAIISVILYTIFAKKIFRRRLYE